MYIYPWSKHNSRKEEYNMINKQYREAAIEEYGHQCEICGYTAIVEVHHIDYQEHQEIENKIRKSKYSELPQLLVQAKNMGYDEWDSRARQLSKNDSTINTSVLCGNCHGYVHLIDMGKALLKALSTRREKDVKEV